MNFCQNPRWQPFQQRLHDMIKILDPDCMGVATGFDLLSALIIKIWRKIGFSWRPFEHIVYDMIKILNPDYMGVATGFDLLTALIIKIWRKIGFSWRPS